MLTLENEIHKRVLAVLNGRPQLGRKVEFRVSKSRDELAAAIPMAQIFFGWRLSDNHFWQAQNLRWIHLASAGIDGALPEAAFKSNIQITCSKGIHKTPMAETAMAMMLALTRNLHVARDLQKEKRWAHEIIAHDLSILERKTLGIIGAGNIGRAIAARAKVFGLKTIGVNSDGHRVPGFAEVKSYSRLAWLLKESDIVVVCSPLTESTRNLLGPRQFALMKKGVILVNIARGRIIDQAALIDALSSRKVSAAALDVFESEPLAADSPLWEMPNVIITPHIGGIMPDLYEKLINLFCDNLEKYLSGKRLSGIVNKNKGY